MTKLTKQQITDSLTALAAEKDDNKNHDFLAGVYCSVMANVVNPEKGLYFGALRKFLCEIFPTMAVNGQNGLWLPALSTFMALQIEGPKTDEEKEALPNWRPTIEVKSKKTPKGTAKYHHVKDFDLLNKMIANMEKKWGEGFKDFVAATTECFKSSQQGQKSKWSNMSASFSNFYK